MLFISSILSHFCNPPASTIIKKSCIHTPAYFLKCQPYKKIALLCVTAPIAIIANILRITLLLLLANHYGAEVAMRFFHDFSSLFLFTIAFIFLIVISHDFSSLFLFTIAFIFLIVISTIIGCKVGVIKDRG